MSKILSLISLLLAATPAVAQETPRWTYGGDQTSEGSWGALSHEYVACGAGTEQSPISITRTKPSGKAPLAFQYKPGNAETRFENNAFTIVMKDAVAVRADGKDYTLESISFHSPSEHLVNGQFYLLEIEFLHRNSEGQRLMVSVFGELGDANTELEKALSNPSLTFDPGKLLPAQQGYYAYRGSLTWPPCTEGVEWRVLKTPITLSETQLAKIGEISERNSRLTQPTYMREVEELN